MSLSLKEKYINFLLTMRTFCAIIITKNKWIVLQALPAMQCLMLTKTNTI